jgi:hypothetical protein
VSVREGLYGLPEPVLPPKPPSRWRWAYRIVFGFLIVGVLTITVLTMLGGNGPSMKTSIEQFIGDSTGLRANIETLNAATLFPVIGMDLENLTLHDASGSRVASFEHFNFSTGFWAALIGQSSLRSVAIKNAHLYAGVLAPGAIEIAYLGIEPQSKDGPHLVLKGRYDSKDVEAVVGLVRRVNLYGASSFDLRDGAVVAAGAGSILLDGVVRTGKSGQRVIEIKALSTAAKDSPLKGQVEISRGISGFDLDGYLAQGKSRVDYNLTLTGQAGARKIDGKLESKILNLGDVLESKDSSSFIGHYRALRDFYEAGHAAPRRDEPFDFTGLNAKIDVKIDALYAGELLWGSVVAPLGVADGVANFGPFTGRFMGGALAGDIVLDATKAPAKLGIDIAVLNQHKTTVTVDLESSGNHTGTLMAGLSGTLTALSADGALPVQGFWNGALAKAIMPALTENEMLPVACGIANFTVEGGAAKSNLIYLDANDMTMTAQGVVDFKEMDLNFQLEPRSKAGDTLSAARVSGPLNAPAIRQISYSLAKTSFALDRDLLVPGGFEMGAADQHPCKAYIKK